WFFSHAPMEDIEAHNYQVTSIFDMESGELAFSLMINGFEFEKALMQEHFNEKYLHSDKYPKATFKGKILKLDELDLSKEGEHKVKIKGEMHIHGVSKEVETEGTLSAKAGKIIGKAKFPIVIEDYNIEIPSLVKDNIDKIIDVTVNIEYSEY